ncbi:hypothetical protein HJG54_34155 [Leptolyngbya sp. NK1-12]|uniref:Uncharacterized protein n=1 Tax=Leptolyngbya sp. NK1-12 TaxID=2547451 RepID=A0AA97AKH8_9CYAN|nr:hypothetical protein [Leptolyngbya sp. NK1-12]WNZ27869.1 hypothetical protein HJG54_34155 [Leptolyngbya sp. NK1-12]
MSHDMRQGTNQDMRHSNSYLNLWDWLDEATQVVDQMPELVQVIDGIDAFESVMQDLLTEPNPVRTTSRLREQLTVASEVLERLAHLLDRKSAEWLAEWNRQTAEGIEASDWTGLVRQSVTFDLSSLLAPPDSAPKLQRRPRPTKDSSLAAPVPLETMLAMVDQFEQTQLTQAQLADLAGEERPQQWQTQIAQILAQYRQAGRLHVTFKQLQQQTNLAPVELWLGLLLSGYPLEAVRPSSHLLDSAQAFYQMEIRVMLAEKG